MVMEVVQEDMGEGSMQCSIHPFKINNTPGGICASCLQEKLGKLVSSSSPVAIFPSTTSSSPSPSFRSDFGTATTTTTATNSSSLSLSSSNARKAKLPFLLTQRKKKKEALMAAANANNSNIVFKRSISTATSRNGSHYVYDSDDYNTPSRRKFWSFLYLQKRGGHKMDTSTLGAQRETRVEENGVFDESESPRRVSRSRSVGCGSRSFSGDFFERISTGFGDCTLRRVESQREGKQPRLNHHNNHSMHRNSIGIGGGQDCIKERVKCGGIFSGFTITSSSSSSSSSYLVNSSSNEENFNGKKGSTPGSHHMRNLGTSTSTKSWSWAFASPLRAFSKPSNGKIDALNKNVKPNLAAIPSLLAGG